MGLRIRALMPQDLQSIKKLHEKYFSQFELPPFPNCLNAFIIEDEHNEVVMAGAVEAVAEAMLVTNKAMSEIKIGKALVEAQQCVKFTCAINKIRDVYAFVDNDVYAKHLVQHGFKEQVNRTLK